MFGIKLSGGNGGGWVVEEVGDRLSKNQLKVKSPARNKDSFSIINRGSGGWFDSKNGGANF